jgi:DNA-3-methyladenine glycosylase I
MTKTKTRCAWCSDDPLYMAYHDNEWGRPVHDDRHLFEMLILEGAQAGLAWITVLRKRDNYREAFDHFDATKIARYDSKRIAKLMNNEGIIRNRLKIEVAIKNAKVFLQIQETFGSFDAYLWAYVENKPIINQWESFKQLPAKTPLSDQIAKDLKKRGMNFVGSTIMYAYMQAIGMVNDHTLDCDWRHSRKT